MDTEKIKQACTLMHKTGADDTQYILVRLRDLEELVEAWERGPDDAGMGGAFRTRQTKTQIRKGDSRYS